MNDVHRALNPRSGTLVLFWQWKNEPFHPQKFYAFGIHRDHNQAPQEAASEDYKKQIEKALRSGVLLLSMCTSRINISRAGGKMGTMAYRFVRPNPQATAQKHDRHPICLGVNALTRCNTKGAD